MACTDSLLSQLNKYDLFLIALNTKNVKLEINSTLTDISNNLSKLQKSYNKLDADLPVSQSLKQEEGDCQAGVKIVE